MVFQTIRVTIEDIATGNVVLQKSFFLRASAASRSSASAATTLPKTTPASPRRCTAARGSDILIGGYARTICSTPARRPAVRTPGSTTCTGNGGNDVLMGAAAVDHIFGGEGDDDLFGYGGEDELWGSNGADYMLGGAHERRALGWSEQ